jgi:hypothetical protein
MYESLLRLPSATDHIAQICKCLVCLPAALEKYVQPFCDSKSGADIAPTADISYVDFSYVAEYDANIQAYRVRITGILEEYTILLTLAIGRP